MGVHKNISHDKFPKQSDRVGGGVKVCFNYDTSIEIPAKILRDDIEGPGEMLLQLLDGTDRIVRAVECQYSFSPRRI